MKKTIYIHIGPHKTGTTTIQSHLFANQKLLLSHGILCPISGRVSTKSASVHNLAWELSQNRRYDPQNGTWQDLVTETTGRIDIQKIILSSEDLSTLDVEQIKTIRQTLADQFDVKIIIYLRRQDQAMQSTWVQLTKSAFSHKDIGTFYDWLEEVNYYSPNVDFYQKIINWGEVFGDENLWMRILSMNNIQGTLFEDFLNLCDIFLKNLKIVPDMNVSPGIKTIEAIRLIKKKMHRNHIPPNHWTFLTWKINQYGDIHKWNQKKLNLLTPELSEKIMAQYSATNTHIAEKFFDGKPLFSIEKHSDKEVDTFTQDEFTKNELVDLFCFLLFNLERK